jgi:hypothetical protein
VQWVEGARPRTLPTALSSVIAGTGAAIGNGVVAPGRAVLVLVLVVAVSLRVGVNYANDYSDGIRGTDDERVGPLRLVGSDLAPPSTVRAVAFVSLPVAGPAGLTLVSLSRRWWLIAVGAACILAAWYYTAHRPISPLSCPAYGGSARCTCPLRAARSSGSNSAVHGDIRMRLDPIIEAHVLARHYPGGHRPSPAARRS